MHRFIYAVAGAGAGALVAWAVTADIYEKKADKERFAYAELLKDKTEHIWALQDRLDNQPDSNAEDTIDIDPNQPSLMDEQVDQQNPIEAVKAVESLESVEPSQVQRLIDQYTASPEAQEEFARLTATPQDGDNRQPFVISRAEYAWSEHYEHYGKITLTYYPNDRVLLDDEDDVFPDIQRDIGWRNLNRFGDQSEDPSVVFIRCDRLETDFEVVKEEEAPLPLHVKYGMEKEEFRVHNAAGLIKLREEDE